ncbi:hypothetical protein L9F63_009283, partial [Diploptera punctata]
YKPIENPQPSGVIELIPSLPKRCDVFMNLMFLYSAGNSMLGILSLAHLNVVPRTYENKPTRIICIGYWEIIKFFSIAFFFLMGGSWPTEST